MTDPIRLGTRASELARTQSATIGTRLAAVSGRPWREVLVRTPGDDTSKPLDQPGSPGLFVSTLRHALLCGEVDVIVHSFKDLPSAPEKAIVLGAVPGRVDPRDALVSRDGSGLAALPAGAVVGTSSPRRAAALRRLRPDLVIRPIRGNVDTRIRKVRDGEYEATVLAVAGLARIGRTEDISEILDDLLPAPAQGALAVECREDDDAMRDALTHLDDPVARLVTTAERQVLVGIDASCTTAVAALAQYREGRLSLRAELTIDDRHTATDLSVACTVDDLVSARTLGLRAAGRITGDGHPDGRLPVLLIRSEGNRSDAQALSEFGLGSISDPYLCIEPVPGGRAARTMADRLAACADDRTIAEVTWLIATSPMTIPAWRAGLREGDLTEVAAAAAAAGVRAAATGERTAATLLALGFESVLLPAIARGADLVAALSDHGPARALFPRSSVALRTVPEGLRQRGWVVEEAVVYDTAAVRERPASATLLERGEVAAVVVRSPSAVHALLAHAIVPAGIPVIAAGVTTAQAARDAGVPVSTIADSPSSPDVARAVRDVLGA